jgi:cytochrome P450
VQLALKHPELFASAGFGALYRPSWLPHNPLADSLLAQDGASHAKLRVLVSRAFTPRSLARIEPRIRVIAGQCAEQLCDRVEAEFIAEFAVVFPARVIAEIGIGSTTLPPSRPSHRRRRSPSASAAPSSRSRVTFERSWAPGAARPVTTW